MSHPTENTNSSDPDLMKLKHALHPRINTDKVYWLRYDTTDDPITGAPRTTSLLLPCGLPSGTFQATGECRMVRNPDVDLIAMTMWYTWIRNYSRTQFPVSWLGLNAEESGNLWAPVLIHVLFFAVRHSASRLFWNDVMEWLIKTIDAMNDPWTLVKAILQERSWVTDKLARLLYHKAWFLHMNDKPVECQRLGTALVERQLFAEVEVKKKLTDFYSPAEKFKKGLSRIWDVKAEFLFDIT